MYKLLPVLIDNMGEAYPELKAQQTLIEKVIKEEEDSFLRTLETGIRLLEKTMNEAKAAGKTEISGVDGFTLYDTFGFPLDLTELILRENGMTVNEEEFKAEMQKQKERARNAAAVETGDWITLNEGETNFVGYDYTEYETTILRYRQVKQKNQTLYQIVLSDTPFYAESGGQVGDTGVLCSEFETIEIIDTKKENNLPIHIAKKLPEHMEAPMMACVDTDKRAACAANHSCTHLLDEALREVLGTHVEQKGSLVSPDSLRFDFSHFQKVTDEELRKVEHLVNAKIRENVALQEYRNIPIEEAKELGAIALFGEKYGDEVRVIQFGNSIEFCGGTHVSSTGKIGMVRIISESSVAAGVRRIEAITGEKVENMIDKIQDTMADLKALFNNVPDLKSAIRKAIEENAGLKKQVEEFMKEKAASLKNELLANAKEMGGIKVIKTVAPISADVAKDIALQLKGEVAGSLLVVIGSVEGGKPMLTVMLSEDLVKNGLKAGNLVKEAAKLIQGGGGGAPHFATAGGKNPEGLLSAVDKVIELAGL
jgi:alanyl-tRNA synthetase